MQPEQSPTTPPTQQPDIAAAQANTRKRVALALWLMIGPTALIIISIALYAIVNFILSTSSDSGNSLFEHPSPLHSVLNILLFLIGSVAVISWLPGLITGIVLLATRKK